MKSSIIACAAAFAETAHGAQKRKYTGEPYIVHPAAVAKIVSKVVNDEEVIAAAWLHDVVEDTPVTLSEIETLFGTRVAPLVEALTDVSKPTDGNREIRKQKDLRHLVKAPAEAQTIKYADLIDNTRSIVEHDIGFAKVYLEEKRRLLEVMDKGDQGLRAIAYSLLEVSTRKLNFQ